MICPNKICAQEIPDDSCFCDQCGVQLLSCKKCNFVGTGKFCGSCGGSMSAIEPSVIGNSAANTPVMQDPVAPVSAATVVVNLPAENIFLCHPDGWNIKISNGDILGRTNGPFTSQLGKYSVISSNHAKITLVNNEWFITDLKSTNKTYINNAMLEPNIPAKIKQNDVVILANVTFTVREA